MRWCVHGESDRMTSCVCTQGGHRTACDEPIGGFSHHFWCCEHTMDVTIIPLGVYGNTWQWQWIPCFSQTAIRASCWQISNHIFSWLECKWPLVMSVWCGGAYDLLSHYSFYVSGAKYKVQCASVKRLTLDWLRRMLSRLVSLFQNSFLAASSGMILVLNLYYSQVWVTTHRIFYHRWCQRPDVRDF